VERAIKDPINAAGWVGNSRDLFQDESRGNLALFPFRDGILRIIARRFAEPFLRHIESKPYRLDVFPDLLTGDFS
jgi:hypothetical protein